MKSSSPKNKWQKLRWHQDCINGCTSLKAMSVNSQKQSVIFKDLCSGVWQKETDTFSSLCV